MNEPVREIFGCTDNAHQLQSVASQSVLYCGADFVGQRNELLTIARIRWKNKKVSYETDVLIMCDFMLDRIIRSLTSVQFT